MAGPYCFFVPEELLEDELEVRPEGRLVPAEERDVPPEDRELPVDDGRGAEVRPELLPTELDERPLGDLVVDRLLPVELEGLLETDDPEGGTTTGLDADDRPENVRGAISWRLPLLEPDRVEVGGDDPYMVGR
jgi:hypothetical protein